MQWVTTLLSNGLPSGLKTKTIAQNHNQEGNRNKVTKERALEFRNLRCSQNVTRFMGLVVIALMSSNLAEECQ